jgi:hypothetical protein
MQKTETKNSKAKDVFEKVKTDIRLMKEELNLIDRSVETPLCATLPVNQPGRRADISAYVICVEQYMKKGMRKKENVKEIEERGNKKVEQIMNGSDVCKRGKN